MSPADLAQQFLLKAAQDEMVVDKLLHDPDVADEVIGFHCQQASEKLLKAVLAAHSLEFRRTHDLVELCDLLADHNIVLTEDIAGVETLNPFAVELRYDLLPAHTLGAFDRDSARSLVAKLRSWAESLLATPGE